MRMPGYLMKWALTETITSIGQLSKEEIRFLEKAVKRGWLEKAKGGEFPALKTVYARPGFDFRKQRADMIKEVMEIARIEENLHLGPYAPR